MVALTSWAGLSVGVADCWFFLDMKESIKRWRGPKKEALTREVSRVKRAKDIFLNDIFMK